MPNIQSRVNGLIVNIPAQARGLLGRFATRGDNELVFVKPKGVVPADAKSGENNTKPVTIESTTIGAETPAADLA